MDDVHSVHSERESPPLLAAAAIVISAIGILGVMLMYFFG
jgi:hypothetical protein